MGKVIFTFFVRLFYILMTLFAIWEMYCVIMFESFSASPTVNVNPIITWYLILIRVYVIIICIAFVVKQFRDEEEFSFYFRYNSVYIVFIIIDMIASVQLIYDILVMLSEIILAIIMLFSLGIMIWHINECHLVLSYKEEQEKSEDEK